MSTCRNCADLSAQLAASRAAGFAIARELQREKLTVAELRHVVREDRRGIEELAAELEQRGAGGVPFLFGCALSSTFWLLLWLVVG